MTAEEDHFVPSSKKAMNVIEGFLPLCVYFVDS